MTITLPPHQTATSFLRHDSTVLQTLFTQLEQLRQLNSILADHIDPSLVNHCLITSLENGCLMLATESAIWGTHIRFQVPHLIAKLQSYPQFKTLRTIHCKVVRPSYRNDCKNPRSRGLPCGNYRLRQLKWC